MDLNSLKKFAQGMRRDLVALMDARIEYVLKQDDEYLRAHAAEQGVTVSAAVARWVERL